MVTKASTPQGATAHPMRAAREMDGRSSSRSLRLALALGLMMGFQGMTAGPAAVATLPSAWTARPFALAPVIAPPAAFTPALGREPGLFASIIESAFFVAK